MGFQPKASLFLSMLLMTFFMVAAVELQIVTDSFPPNSHGHPHPISHPPSALPSIAPIHPPSHHHHHHHHGHPPSQPPVHPPTHAHAPATQPPYTSHPPSHHHKPSPPPAKPPTQPPSHHHAPTQPPSHHAPTQPPSHPPSTPRPIPERKLVAIQGVVYCKSCKYKGIDTLLGALPLLNATVKIQCNNTKYPLVFKTNTDKNGYFFTQAPKTITTYGVHKCKASLVSSSLKSCSIPTDLHGGLSGAMLRMDKVSDVTKKPLPFVVFTVGPFAFEPAKYLKCPKSP